MYLPEPNKDRHYSLEQAAGLMGLPVERVLKLIKISRLKLSNIEFYQYRNKWKKIVNFSSFSNNSLAKYKPVKSIVCFELKNL